MSNDPKITKMILKGLNDSLKKIIAREFRLTIDPHEKKWKRKKIPNGKPTLIDTGRMRRSFRYIATADKINIRNNCPYFVFHQTGTKHMPKRQMLPKTDKLTKSWRQQISKDMKKLVDKICKQELGIKR